MSETLANYRHRLADDAMDESPMGAWARRALAASYAASAADRLARAGRTVRRNPETVRILWTIRHMRKLAEYILKTLPAELEEDEGTRGANTNPDPQRDWSKQAWQDGISWKWLCDLAEHGRACDFGQELTESRAKIALEQHLSNVHDLCVEIPGA